MKKQVRFYRLVAGLLSGFVLGVILTACDAPAAAPPQNQTQPQTSIKQTFDNQITLLGFTATDAHDRLQLFWQAVNIPSGDYVAFVHILDEQGKLIAQMDKTPGNNNHPTSQWKQGEVITDEYVLQQPNLVSGTYTLQIGLYNLTTAKRLAVKGNANGTVTITKFEIKKN